MFSVPREDTFRLLLPAFSAEPEKVAGHVRNVLAGDAADNALAHIMQMRHQRQNLNRRRQAFLLRWNCDESIDKLVEVFMKEHRRAFENSEVQRRFRELDIGKGMRQHQVRSRQDTRFNSMLHEEYGGRKAIRTFLCSGRMCDIRVPPLDRLPVGTRRPEPPVKARTRKRKR